MIENISIYTHAKSVPWVVGCPVSYLGKDIPPAIEDLIALETHGKPSYHPQTIVLHRREGSGVLQIQLTFPN